MLEKDDLENLRNDAKKMVKNLSYKLSIIEFTVYQIE